MYQIIYDIIAHPWVSNYSNDQQYIYYICGAIIIVFAVAFVDGIKTLLGAFLPIKRKE